MQDYDHLNVHVNYGEFVRYKHYHMSKLTYTQHYYEEV